MWDLGIVPAIMANEMEETMETTRVLGMYGGVYRCIRTLEVYGL